MSNQNSCLVTNLNATNLNKTKWFNYVTEEDLNTTNSYESMIMFDSENLIFAYQKACGNRTIFPSNIIWHPTDGNCIIFEDDSLVGHNRECMYLLKPNVQFNFERIRTIKQLNEAIDLYISAKEPA